jgi:membrane protein
VIRNTSARAADLAKRGGEWADRRDPGSPSGVAVSAWRHYRAVDGPLQSALLALYILVAVLPALLVMEAYFDPHPNSLANSLVRSYHLDTPTAGLIHGVLREGRRHEVGSALLAIAGALFFGLGFGRVLQLVHQRAWRLDPREQLLDQGLYAAVLLGLYGLILLLLVQLNVLKNGSAWIDVVLTLAWVVLLVLFFVWAPWLLTHKQLTRRELLPSAVLTALGLVLLMLVSNYLMQFWIDLYAVDYGGLGVVLALYFWLALASAIVVWAASLSPALADRRELRRSR